MERDLREENEAKMLLYEYLVIEMEEPESYFKNIDHETPLELFMGDYLTTALSLSQMDTRCYRTVRELIGESCIDLDDSPEPKQQIMCSRSFGEKIADYSTLRETICEFAARAAEKLRGEGQFSHVVNVFIRTSPFVKTDPSYSNSATGKLISPSADTRNILALTTKLFDAIWKDGYRYAKAGVMLGDFCSPDQVQGDLFAPKANSEHRDKLMQAVDTINNSGQGQIWFGGQRPKRDWFMNQAHLSPAYTTRWDCLPLV